MENYRERLNQFIDNEGRHLSDIIFKKNWYKTALSVLFKIKYLILYHALFDFH
jgi:hypothetical protein